MTLLDVIDLDKIFALNYMFYVRKHLFRAMGESSDFGLEVI